MYLYHYYYYYHYDCYAYYILLLRLYSNVFVGIAAVLQLYTPVLRHLRHLFENVREAPLDLASVLRRDPAGRNLGIWGTSENPVKAW